MTSPAAPPSAQAARAATARAVRGALTGGSLVTPATFVVLFVIGALLAYWVGNALSGYPIASFFISGGITTVIIVVVFWLESRRSGTNDALVPSTD